MMIGAWVFAPNTRSIPGWISRLKDCLNCAWDSEYLITNTGELRPAHSLRHEWGATLQAPLYSR